MIPDPLSVTLWAFGGGVMSTVGFFALSLYSEYKSWERHVIWEDDATRRERVQSHWNNLKKAIDARNVLVNYVPLWYTVGFLYVFVLIVMSVGVGVIYL